MEGFIQLIDDCGPQCVGADGLGQELSLGVSPIGRFKQSHVSRQLMGLNESGDRLVVGVEAQLKEQVGHARNCHADTPEGWTRLRVDGSCSRLCLEIHETATVPSSPCHDPVTKAHYPWLNSPTAVELRTSRESTMLLPISLRRDPLNSPSLSSADAPEYPRIKPLCVMVHLALGGLLLAAAPSTLAQARSAGSEAEPAIEEVVVTGSLIRRTPNDGTVPVSVIGEEAME